MLQPTTDPRMPPSTGPSRKDLPTDTNYKIQNSPVSESNNQSLTQRTLGTRYKVAILQVWSFEGSN